MNIKLELLKSEIAQLIAISLDKLDIDADRIADTAAINALSEIRDVIQNDVLSDFEMVERIVCIFEKYNISSGVTHDFG